MRMYGRGCSFIMIDWRFIVQIKFNQLKCKTSYVLRRHFVFGTPSWCLILFCLVTHVKFNDRLWKLMMQLSEADDPVAPSCGGSITSQLSRAGCSGDCWPSSTSGIFFVRIPDQKMQAGLAWLLHLSFLWSGIDLHVSRRTHNVCETVVFIVNKCSISILHCKILFDNYCKIKA